MLNLKNINNNLTNLDQFPGLGILGVKSELKPIPLKRDNTIKVLTDLEDKKPIFKMPVKTNDTGFSFLNKKLEPIPIPLKKDETIKVLNDVKNKEVSVKTAVKTNDTGFSLLNQDIKHEPIPLKRDETIKVLNVMEDTKIAPKKNRTMLYIVLILIAYVAISMISAKK